MAAGNGHIFIDLTLDDDDEGIKDLSGQYAASTIPRTAPRPRPPDARAHSQLVGASPSRADAQVPRQATGCPVVHKKEHSPRPQPNGFPLPPAKRAKTRETFSPDIRGERLKAYLVGKLWPAIDEAIYQLAPGCDGERWGVLHRKVSERVVSDGFGQHWEGSQGHLSEAFEAALRRKIRGLVVELRDGPERLSPTLVPQNGPPTVLPSIETKPSLVNGDSVRNAAFAPTHPAAPASSYAPTTSRLTHTGLDAPIHLPALTLRSPTKQRPSTSTCSKSTANTAQWQPGKAMEKTGPQSGTSQSRNKWFGLSLRPYLAHSVRQELLSRDRYIRPEDSDLPLPAILHVDFSDSEIRYLQYAARELYGSKGLVTRSPATDLRHLVKKARKLNRLNEITKAHREHYRSLHRPAPVALTTRTADDVANFLEDQLYRTLRPTPETLTLSRDGVDIQYDIPKRDRVPSLLYTREVAGNRGFGSIRRYQNFPTAFRSNHEDKLEPHIQWTNCAGDIATLSWVSESHFICGTTTHSDSHNQQYNKPGNLLLGSSSHGTLRAFPDHRITRPVVALGDNALDSMVESQDPWLYTSVVDSDYDARRDLAFTSSFDRTVRVWKIKNDRMEPRSLWEHDGRVNFVLASHHPSGLVATAADVPTNAIRVYHIDSPHMQAFDSYSCTRIHDEEFVPSEKWGYFPAAIRWGLAPHVQHLLLIGYSPRSFTGDDHDIPEDKMSTGELCLWDTITKTQVKVNSLATQNVFEVVWHPFQDIFAVATSKAMSLENTDSNVKTQIRIFAREKPGEGYSVKKALDCPAVDINELVIRPNSVGYSYVAAGCTDGNVYVWDTAGSDSPMCVLKHGDPVEELLGEKELEDVGVKFLAWGTTADRLYTGSSDGVVKVWNIRHGKAVHVRDLVEVPGPITAGAFSPNFTKLVIGDGSGKVHLIGLEKDKDKEEEQNKPPLGHTRFLQMQVGGRQRAIRRPRPFIPHPDVPPPGAATSAPSLQLGQERARGYLDRGELVVHPHPAIGAVQGPHYMNTGLLRAEAHRDEDATQPLLGAFERHQQENTRHSISRKKRKLRKIQEPDEDSLKTHDANLIATWSHQQRLMLNPTRLELEAERAEIESDYGYDYEPD
ncbi:uncharacterized protein JN550_006139 [Neoarthrinium moseri]|uniref:uncharacterized protein n=1 Tax=Neoarthrinium moseri TaxID=1658444 RepID=UPI001FDDC105|nr:uncharacterized protein JN550_006139 [Neoarthrinium moseri]KAI1869152.1 hypothetical protein JN550_006139 [Neoarthrinium moseri]